MRIAYVTETYPPELNGVVAHRRAHGALSARARPRRRADPAAPARRRRRACAGRARRGVGVADAPAFRSRCIRTCASALATAGPLRRRYRPVAARSRAPRDPRPARLGGAARRPVDGHRHQLRLPHPLPALQRLLRPGRLRVGRARGLALVPQPQRPDLRADRVGGARARGERLPPPERRRPRRRHRALQPARRSPRCARPWGAAPTHRCCCTVGRIAAEKNVALGTARFEALRRRDPSRAWSSSATARCGAARRGASGGDLRRRAARRRAGGALRVGRRLRLPEPLRHLRQRHLEALASGLPVVAFDVGGGRPSTSPTASPAGSSRPTTRPASSARSPPRRAPAAHRGDAPACGDGGAPGALGRGARALREPPAGHVDGHETPSPAAAVVA